MTGPAVCGTVVALASPGMDTTLFHWINNLSVHLSWANGVVKFYANWGIALFGLLLVIAFLDARRRGDRAGVAGTAWAGGAALAALGLAQIIGGAIDRARPYTTLSQVHVLVDKSADFSFPSDHATTAGAVAVGLLFAVRRWGRVAVVAGLAMAIARVWCGAHYPGDLAAGLALGGLVAAIGHFLVTPLLTRLVDALSTTKLRPLLVAASPAPG